MTGDRTSYLQRCLERLQQGDEAARNDLLAGVCERMGQLAHVMLKDFGRLKRWEETGDVVQNALVRLSRTLQQVTPASLRDFYRLATLQIRRELIDLVRHYYGPEGPARRHHSNSGDRDADHSHQPAYDRPDSGDGPTRLAVWREFHEQVHALPEEEQEIFDLIWYQGLTHAQAAALLNISTKTVQRRWHAACLTLHEALHGEMPE